MDYIKLDTGQQMIARMLAEQRHAMNRQAGVRNARIGAQDDAFTDLNGIGGELAFCILANVCPDLRISPRRGGEDCLTARGWRVDVKTSKYEDAQLIAVLGKLAYSDDAWVYVLMIGVFPLYRCAGWAWGSELLRKENITDLGYGPTYALPQAALRPFVVQSSRPGQVTTSTEFAPLTVKLPVQTGAIEHQVVPR